MKYFRVLKKHDQKIIKSKKNDEIYVGNEIYTEKEVIKKQLNYNFLEEVQISKFKTHYFFGSRFENGFGLYE